jgi:protein-S-isoprenylcysteine O-methyltransferase Ste14
VNAELPRRELIKAFLSLAVTLLVMAALLFLVAGTLDWVHGWLFMLAFLALVLVSIAALWRLNPEIFVARARATGQGTKGWDRVVMSILLAALAAILPVAALDDGRFHWAPAPDWAIGLGHLLLVVGFAGVAWAQAVNRHFEPSVRIQTERDHQVVTTGPYAHVRHPGYIFGSLLAVGTALALGSCWALLPAALVVVLMLLRTNLEDAMLKRELPGYAEFATKTRFRWIPGVW